MDILSNCNEFALQVGIIRLELDEVAVDCIRVFEDGSKEIFG